MSDRSSVTIFAKELANALETLVATFRLSGAMRDFLEDLGWKFIIVPDSIQSIQAPIELAYNIANSKDTIVSANIVVLLDAIRTAFKAISSLRSAGDLDEDFRNEFPRQLIDYILAKYFLEQQPHWGYPLLLFGIIRLEEIPAIGNRPPYLRHVFALDDLGKVLTDPLDSIKNVFHWGESNFEGERLLQNLADLLDTFGFDVGYDSLDQITLDQLNKGALWPDKTFDSDLRLIFFESRSSLSKFNIGIGFFILPKTAIYEPGLSLLPFASGTLDEEIELSDEITLSFKSHMDLTEGVGILVHPKHNIDFLSSLASETPSVTSGNFNTTIRFTYQNAGSKILLIGFEEGSRLQVGAISLEVGININAKAKSDVYAEFKFEDSSIVINPSSGQIDSFLSSIIPKDGLSPNFSLILGFSSSRGFYLGGSSGLETNIPAHKSIGPVEINGVNLAIKPAGGVIPLDIGTTIKCEMGPLRITVENLGLQASFSFPSDYSGNLGPMDLDMAFKPPKGIGLSIDAGAIKGGGYLDFDPKKEEYFGTLELVVSGWLNLKGIGLINTRLPGGQPGFSMLVIITADFGETGYQLGYGFTLLKVGGLLGLNRTLKIEALAEGIRTNAISSLMFPKDVVANAPRIISDLRAIFPPQEDTFLIAPMAEIGWGTPTLIRVSLGVIIELPSSNIAIVGVLKVALPSEQTPLLAINVGFLGVIQPSKSRLWFFARLFDSNLLGITIEGEAGLLMAWGENASFVLSVGGFHPSFTPPPLPFPVPERITLNILDHDNARIRISGYFAVTSNTVQFGAKAELYFGFSGFNVSGQMAFDALLQLSPFYFMVQVSCHLSLTVFGIGLFGIGLDLSLEGPTPWHVQGNASLRILFFTIRVPIDITWGESHETSLEDIKIMPLVIEEFKKPQNWTAELPDSYNLLVTMRELDEAPDVIILHPLGTLRVSQRLVPLDVQLDKMGNKKISDYRKLTVDSSDGFKKSGDTKEMFAMAQFQEMGDADRLSLPSYQKCNAGLLMSDKDQELSSSHMVRRVIRYETVIIDSNYRRSEPTLVGIYKGLFTHSLNSNAVTKSALSKAHKRQLDPFEEKEKIKLKPESYTIVLAGTNQAYHEATAQATAFESESLAREYMQKQIRKDPNRAELLQVIPTSEVC